MPSLAVNPKRSLLGFATTPAGADANDTFALFSVDGSEQYDATNRRFSGVVFVHALRVGLQLSAADRALTAGIRATIMTALQNTVIEVKVGSTVVSSLPILNHIGNDAVFSELDGGIGGEASIAIPPFPVPLDTSLTIRLRSGSVAPGDAIPVSLSVIYQEGSV